MMDLSRALTLLVLTMLVGCASHIVQTGKGSYMALGLSPRRLSVSRCSSSPHQRGKL